MCVWHTKTFNHNAHTNRLHFSLNFLGNFFSNLPQIIIITLI